MANVREMKAQDVMRKGVEMIFSSAPDNSLAVKYWHT